MEVDKDADFKEKLKTHIEKLANPNQENDFLESLECLNALLISSNFNQIREVSKQLDLDNLFRQFNAANEEVFSDSFISVISMFMEAQLGDEVLIKHFDIVLEGLYSPNVIVVDLWLKNIVKPVFVNEAQLKSITNSKINLIPLLRAVIRLTPHISTMVANTAHDISVIASKACRQEFFSPINLEELNHLKTLKKPDLKVDPDVLKIRIYTLVVDISCCSQLLLDLMKANGFLTEITDEFSHKMSDDPLVALNMTKLMTDLASQPHGLEFLRTSTSIFTSIAKRIKEFKMDDAFDSLLIPGLINFFVRVAEFDLDYFSQYPIVIERILTFIEKGTKNPEFFILGIDSIAYVCKKNEGKLFLSKRILKQIARIIEVGNTEMKGRVMIALNGIMEVKGADPGDQANKLTETWYRYLDAVGCGISKFMKIAQEPFPDLRLQALNFIRILANSVWGQQILANEPGFLEYILDRQTETNREGVDVKYEIIRDLVMSPFIRLSFTPESILRMRAYFNAGPIDSEMNVAFENA
ncbi:26S proteasome non-ATPase regulatory subunit 5 [Blomia tropicalis]|nr:26S proteasome non-ATPase regulatory subunit 5 [Blomia tropicalis]